MSVTKTTMNKKWNIDKVFIGGKPREAALTSQIFDIHYKCTFPHAFKSVWHSVNLIDLAGVHGTSPWQIQECKPALKYNLTLFPHDHQADAHVKSPQRLILALWCFIILSEAVRSAQCQALNLSALERKSEAIKQQYWLKFSISALRTISSHNPYLMTNSGNSI